MSKGSTRALLDLLNKQEVCMSYRSSLDYLKEFAKVVERSRVTLCEQLQWRGAMIIFDNLNIPKRVSHLRVDSANEFFSWVVGLLVPIYRMPPPYLERSCAEPMGKRSHIDSWLHKFVPQPEDAMEVEKFFVKEVAQLLCGKEFFPQLTHISENEIKKYWEDEEVHKYKDFSKYGMPDEIADIEVAALPKMSKVVPIGLIDKDENTEMGAILEECVSSCHMRIKTEFPFFSFTIVIVLFLFFIFYFS